MIKRFFNEKKLSLENEKISPKVIQYFTKTRKCYIKKMRNSYQKLREVSIKIRKYSVLSGNMLQGFTCNLRI
jgi:hypothetical protein